MTELKTLKDLEMEEGEYVDKETWANNDFIYELKQEAIKWIKEIERQKKEVFNPKYSGYQTDIVSADNTILWIKHFFDISQKEIEDA